MPKLNSGFNICVDSDVTGTEETGSGQRSGPARIGGSCRVSDSAEFGSLTVEAVLSPGKMRTCPTCSVCIALTL